MLIQLKMLIKFINNLHKMTKMLTSVKEENLNFVKGIILEKIQKKFFDLFTKLWKCEKVYFA